MTPRFLPRDVKHAIELIQRDPAHPWTLHELASSCGAARRTLQRHFRPFADGAPVAFLSGVRLEEARRQLLCPEPAADVTAVATGCGFTHLGHFAGWYHERYGECPSKTLRRGRAALAAASRSPPPVSRASERPGLALLPFGFVGAEANKAAGLTGAIAAALCRHGWLSVTSPDLARYHLHGKVRADGQGRLRATLMLFDVSNARYLWADSWDGNLDDVFTFEDHVSVRLAQLLQNVLRPAEIDKARRQDLDQLDAWGLTMRALADCLVGRAEGDDPGSGRT